MEVYMIRWEGIYIIRHDNNRNNKAVSIVIRSEHMIVVITYL